MAEDLDKATSPARRVDETRGSAAVGAAATVLGLCASVAVLLWVYIVPYLRIGTAVPVGSDTSTYIWRARMIQATGLASLVNGSPFQFQASGSNPDRAGLLIVASSLRAVFNIGAWRFMWILPALMAVVVCMAAWALARALHEPGWAGPIYGLAAATSAAFAITARGYFDNLLTDPLLIGVAAAALLVIAGKPGLVAGVLLLTAALVTHWAFGVYFLAVLVGFAVLLAPASLRARRQGDSLLSTPSGLVVTMAVGAVAAGGAMILWALPGAQEISPEVRSGYIRKLHLQLPWYRLGLTLPVAIVGAVALPLGQDRGQHRRERLRGLMLLLVWLLPVAGGTLVYWRGGTVALQRILGFAFPIYFLAAAALVAAGRFALSRRGLLRGVLAVLAAGLVGVALVAGVRNAASSMEDAQPMVQPLTYSILSTTADYVRAVRPTGSVVYVVDQGADAQAFGMVGAFRRIRAQTPGQYMSQVSTYLGDPEKLLAGQPTSRPDVPGFDVNAQRWTDLASQLADLQVVFVVQPFNQNYDAILLRHPDWEVAPGILLARGPKPPPTLTFADPPVRPSTRDLIDETLLGLLLLTVCGMGWSVGLLRSGWTDRFMLAPSLGMAAIMVVGILGGRAGLSMTGSTMVGLTAAAAMVGWVPPFVRWLRRMNDTSGEDAP